ncbi:MAG: hypothetical protein K0S47_3795 [Herbinix sp.]|jgi:hypothetical protein|nr:hypothetical protein [Herbinix sp.]
MIYIENAKEFGDQILNLMNEGYLILCVHKNGNQIICIEAYGYDKNKNKDVYYHDYTPYQYYTITDSGDHFVDVKSDSFDFIPVFLLKESMIREARKIQKKDGDMVEIYRTKKNRLRAEDAWGLGSVFCNEWANEFGWTQEEEEDASDD